VTHRLAYQLAGKRRSRTHAENKFYGVAGLDYFYTATTIKVMNNYYYDREECSAFMEQDGFKGLSRMISSMEPDRNVVILKEDTGDGELVNLLSEWTLSTLLSPGQLRTLRMEVGYYLPDGEKFVYVPA
jgi:hypothetical protein